MKKIFTLLLCSLLLSKFIFAQTNLIYNPDFENGLNGWTQTTGISTVVNTAEEVIKGNNTLKLGPGAYSTIVQFFGVETGKTYVLSAWGKELSPSGSDISRVGLKTWAGADFSNKPRLEFTSPEATFKFIKTTFPSTDTIKIELYTRSGGSDICYLDDIKLYEYVAPTCQINEPSEGSTFVVGDQFKIKSTATNSSFVKYYADGNFIGQGNDVDFEFNIDFNSAGTKQITAVAFNEIGDSVISNPVIIEVTEKSTNNENLIQNPGFETGDFNGWENWGNPKIVVDAASGNYGAMVPLSNWGNGLSKRVYVRPNSTIHVSFDAKITSKSNPVEVKFSQKDANGKQTGPDPNDKISVESKEYKSHQMEFETLENAVAFDFWIGEGRSDTIYIDNIEVSISETNLIGDGDFSTGDFTGWTGNWGSPEILVDSISENYYAMIPLKSWGNGFGKNFKVDSDSVYYATFRAKVAATSKLVEVKFSQKDANGKQTGPDPNSKVSVISKNWAFYSIQFKTLSDAASVDFWIGEGKSDTIYIDEIFISKVPQIKAINYVVNGDFETGDFSSWSGWGTKLIESIDQFQGNYGVNVPKCGAVEQQIHGLKPNTTYILQTNAKSGNVTTIAWLGVKDYGSNPEIHNELISTEYTNMAVQFTTGENSDSAYIYLYNPCNNSASIFADNFSIEEGVDEDAPSAIKNIIAVPAENSIKLNWDVATDLFGISGYIISINGVIADTITEAEYTASGLKSETNYTFEVTAIDNNNNTSEAVTVDGKTSSITGIEESNSNSRIKIYPNPATDKISIGCSGGIKCISLLNLTGQELYKVNISGNNAVLRTTELNNGLYILRVTEISGKVGLLKMIKN
jgi:hypothetical protein